jgi:hypothetical protein
MKKLITGLIIQVFLLGTLVGCAYSTQLQVGKTGIAYTSAIHGTQ